MKDVKDAKVVKGMENVKGVEDWEIVKRVRKGDKTAAEELCRRLYIISDSWAKLIQKYDHQHPFEVIRDELVSLFFLWVWDSYGLNRDGTVRESISNLSTFINSRHPLQQWKKLYGITRSLPMDEDGNTLEPEASNASTEEDEPTEVPEGEIKDKDFSTIPEFAEIVSLLQDTEKRAVYRWQMIYSKMLRIDLNREGVLQSPKDADLFSKIEEYSNNLIYTTWLWRMKYQNVPENP